MEVNGDKWREMKVNMSISVYLNDGTHHKLPAP